MTSDTHPSPNRLTAFDAGLLAPDDQAAVERHVAGCPACCRFLESLPENVLAAQIREFAGRSTAVGSETPLPEQSPELPLANLPAELRDHPRFRVLNPLGSGGMGTVYRAVQRHLDRVVALKVLHRRLTDLPGFAERFGNEVKALARLNHPNVVAAYDADRAGDLHFLVMEFVEGESLEAAVARRGPLPVAEACELIRQAALGLQHAHEQGLVHRDVKPANLLLTPSGVVKVADFGLARLAGAEDAKESTAPGEAPLVLGTPEYMAPEQARAPGRADVRADLYSLGCTLYFLLSGRPPFVGASRLQILLDHQDAPPPVIPGLPAPVAAVLARLLAKDPEGRFTTPAAAADALARAASGEPAPPASSATRARRRALAFGVVFATAAAVAGAAFALRPHDRTAEPSPPQPDVAPELALPGAAVAPMPRTVDRASPEQLLALRRQATGRMVEWVRANNKWGPDAEIATSTAARVAGAPPTVDGYVLGFGSGLLKPGMKPMLLSARTGSFFVFELTPEQARGAGLTPMGHWISSHSHPTDARRVVPGVRLSDLRLDDADAHRPNARVTGTINCEFPTAPRADEYLRITHYSPDFGRVMFLYRPKPPPPAGRVPLRFSANPLEPRTGKGDRLVVIFAEWVSDRAGVRVIESNTEAALLLVAEHP